MEIVVNQKIRLNPAASDGCPPLDGDVLKYDWAQLDRDVLECIFKRLDFIDLCRTKTVCPWWTKTFAYTFKKLHACPALPWLVFPPQEDNDHLCRGFKTGRFWDFEDDKFYPFNNIAAENYCFIGSSHGWLVCLDKQVVPFLSNPFTFEKIQLPPLGSLLGISGFERTANGQYEIGLRMPDETRFIRTLRERFVRKAVLSSCPSHRHKYYAVLIYGPELRLAFYKDGDSSWTELVGGHKPYEPYEDIICNQKQIYALTSNAELDVWDIIPDGLPIKKMYIENDIWRTLDHIYLGNLCTRYYLVESAGNLLLVIRTIIMYLKDADDDGESNDTKMTCYTTLTFNVFKLDTKKKLWIEIGSLGDRALFVGRNESISIEIKDCKSFKQDSIYFSDDFWASLEADHLRGQPDIGLFCFEDREIQWRYECETENIGRPSTWVVPHPW
ncbi:hypothetical protein HS088_TW03G00614 [Tripterygium wilfordii]|uniref:F-box protein n=1 Tax=Tripterygium wilfordii TaxID=458696 RepID=A0A7J7DV78_TRIWF|nr:probable F-box protein At4g22165 [Tripterygium wilfordii]KAF5750280.1 hypothetical protein HS088_TW03G00614 [Tripterygium wilfordii]